MESLMINAFIKPMKVISTYRKDYIGGTVIQKTKKKNSHRNN